MKTAIVHVFIQTFGKGYGWRCNGVSAPLYLQSGELTWLTGHDSFSLWKSKAPNCQSGCWGDYLLLTRSLPIEKSLSEERCDYDQQGQRCFPALLIFNNLKTVVLFVNSYFILKLMGCYFDFNFVFFFFWLSSKASFNLLELPQN